VDLYDTMNVLFQMLQDRKNFLACMDELFYDNLVKLYDLDFLEKKLWKTPNQEEFYLLSQGGRRSYYKEYSY